MSIPPHHKFSADSGMTFQEVYDFAIKETIPVIQSVAKELGEAHFLEVFKKASIESGLEAGKAEARSLPCNDLASFTADLKNPNHFWQHVLSYDIIEDKPQAFEIKVTECLWAKTFREIGAENLGYLLICHPDYAVCQGFNPKIHMTRSKTLMQGDAYCDHRWIWEE